jgi:glycosyltransferase involved in cell wall biosynthesis
MPGKIVVGVAARLAEEKGIEYIIEAVMGLDAKLVIAGPINPVGEEVYRKKVSGLVENHKDKVLFTGKIEPEEMGAVYKNIDILVMGSINRTEAFGMVQVEAMKMGVPVVTTDLPGVRVPVLETGMGEIVAIKSAEEIRSAIKKVIDNRNYYVKKVEIVNQMFDFDRTIDAYERLSK